MKKDISIMIGETKFNFRVACLITRDNKMLLHRNERVDDFWNLVGGRVKCGENTKNAIIRELKEECDCEFEAERLRLIEVNENFFNYENIDCHELNFVYHIELNDLDKIANKQDFGSCDQEGMIYHWFDKSEVNEKNIKCLPKIIYQFAKRKNFDSIEWNLEDR